MDITIPENGFLYVYVTNESRQKVDFDHLSIIHRTGPFVEENHYYPYGMLIEKLSRSVISPMNNYKFNGDHYETANNLFTYFTPYRDYDPVTCRWNQIDPIKQFMNGYFAFAGNPVSFSDPSGLSAIGGRSFAEGFESGSTPRDPFDYSMIGGGPFLSASGASYTSSEIIAANQLARFYEALPPSVQEAIGRNGSDFAYGVINGEINIKYTPGKQTYSEPVKNKTTGGLLASLDDGPILTVEQGASLIYLSQAVAPLGPIGELIPVLVGAGMIIYNISDDEFPGIVPKGDLRPVGKDEINKMKRNGFDPHDGGKPRQGSGGAIDFWVDTDGWLFYRQGRNGHPNPVRENMFDYLK